MEQEEMEVIIEDTPKVRFCPICQELREHKYCGDCGSTIEEIDNPRCKCGRLINWGDRYCPDCGTYLIRSEKQERQRELLKAWLRRKFFGDPNEIKSPWT